VINGRPEYPPKRFPRTLAKGYESLKTFFWWHTQRHERVHEILYLLLRNIKQNDSGGIS